MKSKQRFFVTSQKLGVIFRARARVRARARPKVGESGTGTKYRFLPQLFEYLLFFSLLLLTTGCTKHKSTPTSHPVKVGETTVEDVPYFVKGVGQLAASLVFESKAQVSGTLTNVLFSDGQPVEEGDLLMTIDQRIYQAQVQEAMSQLAEDRAKLKYALEFAETYGKLVGNDYVSRLDYEQAIQNVATYTAAVELDLATIKKNQVALDYTEVRAPFKGYSGLRKFDPGNYVDPASGEILVTIRKVTPLGVKFYLPSEFVQEIREQQKETPLYLEAELPDDPAHPLQGTLWFIDNYVNPKTGMILLQGNIPNLDERGWPGQFVRVHLRLKTLKDVVLVPKSALILGESGNYVFVLDETTMSVKTVMVGKGFVYKDSIVALWGLKGGEKVIIDGQLNLTNNAKVYIPNTSHESIK